jgi:hypothetical protein
MNVEGGKSYGWGADEGKTACINGGLDGRARLGRDGSDAGRNGEDDGHDLELHLERLGFWCLRYVLVCWLRK